MEAAGEGAGAPEGMPPARTGTPPAARTGTPPARAATLPTSHEFWQWGDSERERKKLLDLFQMIDIDHSHFITTTELRHMLINLGENVTDPLVSDMLAVVDANDDKKIDFDEFVKVMTGAKGMANVKHSLVRFESWDPSGPEQVGDRPVLDDDGQKQLNDKLSGKVNVLAYSNEEMRYLFNEMDEDRGGTLDREELMELANKIGKAVKPRDMVDVMKYMDPENTGGVTFPMFRNWLLDTNLLWTDLLVLPEGVVATIRKKAAPQLNRLKADQEDPAKTEWKRLSLLLKAMGVVVECWGTPDMMYGRHINALEKRIGELLEQPTSNADGQDDQGTLTPQQRDQKVNELRNQLKRIAPTSKLCESVDVEVSWSVLNYTEVERELKLRNCFFHPNERFRMVWDILQVFLLLYLVISLPLRMSFEVEVSYNSFAFWFDVCVDLYFWVDIVVNFRTAFYNERGDLIINQRKIALVYLKGWFIVDLVTCLPISYLFMALHGVDSAGEGKQVRLFKILRLLKLAKLLRVTRLSRILDRYRVQLHGFLQAAGGVLLGLVIVMCTHVYACIWYYVGTIDQPASIHGTDRTPGSNGWVYRNYGLGCDDDGNHVDTADHWSNNEDLADIFSTTDPVCTMPSRLSRYMTSMYWALMTISTVGYGDYTAETDLEKVWSMFTMLFGALVFATITGEISARLTSARGSIQAYYAKMDEMRDFCISSNLPAHLTRKIEGQYVQMYGDKCIYNDKDILGPLPWTVVRPVLEFLYDDVMRSSALFTQLVDPERCSYGSEIIANISMQLRRVYASPGLIVMQEGQFGNSMLFVQTGEVEIYKLTTSGRLWASGEQERTEQLQKKKTGRHLNKHGARLGRLGARGFFGELGVMKIPCQEHVKVVRTRTAIAKSHCVLLELQKNDLDTLRQQYDGLEKSMANLEKGLMQNEGIGDLAIGPATTDDRVHIAGPQMDPQAIGELINAVVETRLEKIEMQLAQMKSDTNAKLDRLLDGIASRGGTQLSVATAL